MLRITPGGHLADPAFMQNGDLLRLLGVLDAAGEEARVIGGAVRNTLLGRAVADVDIATTALPDEVMRLARRAGLRPIPTGIAHGTVTVLVGSSVFEVTTLREDVETDGRHAVVRFSRDFTADAARRDFTINALSVGADALIHDTTGGIPDLAAGCVRFIGEADLRIREDYLRLLRFFRFHAAYGVGPLDPVGLQAAVRHREALARLSRERVRAEWLKLLAASGAVAVVERLVETGIAAHVLSVPCRPERLGRLAAAEAQRGLAADPVLRLAALAADSPADALALREDLRLSNEERDRIAAAVSARAGLEGPPDPQTLRTLLYEAGPQAALDGLLLAAAADASGRDEAWQESLSLLAREPPPRLPLGGADVLARGVSGGRQVGAILKHLQASWIRAGFPQDPALLARLLDEAIAATRQG